MSGTSEHRLSGPSKLTMMMTCGVFVLNSKSETRSSQRKKSSADLGFHYPGDLLSQARPRRRPLHKRNTVSDFANSKCRQTSTAVVVSSVEPGKSHVISSAVHLGQTEEFIITGHR